MRICLVSLDYVPYRTSGLTVYAEDLARGLAELDHTVTVIAALRPGTVPHVVEGNIQVRRVPIGRTDWLGYSVRAAQALSRIQLDCEFDVVHFLDVHFAYAYRGPYMASLWQSFRQRRTADGGLPYATGAGNRAFRLAYYTVARHWMERTSVARAVGLISACHSTTHEFVTHYSVAPNRISHVVQGTNLAMFTPVASLELRKRLQLEGKRIVLFLGFATARKGLEYLAQALRLLPTDVVWVFVGQWERGYRKKIIAALGDAANRFVEVGPIADQERRVYYSLADVYVSPSLLEGFGLTPIEAQACGTPAIVTDASSGREEVGSTGVVVPARNAAALAEAILDLLEHPIRRAELGASARARVQSNTYQRMAAATVQVYRRCLAGTNV